MNHRIIRAAIVLTAVFALAGGLRADEEALKTLSESGITVSYPAHMEVQAKRILGIAKESIQPSIDVHRQMVALLSNADAMSKDIANLLGADEKSNKIKERLLGYKNNSDALVHCFSNIRLVKTGDAIGAGGIDCGVLRVRYDKTKAEFNMVIDQSDSGPDILKRSYFPVFVNADGSIRAESKLVEMAIDFLGTSKTMIIAPVHDTVGYMMIKELYVYYPLSRWFNEGISGWITRFVVTKTNPKLAQLANDMLTVNAASKQMRDKVNLLAWPQRAFQNLQPPYYDKALEAAQTQYSVELISNLLGKDGPNLLPKIMGGVNYNANADLDTIFTSIKKATGKDVKPILLTYVPADIQTGIASADAPKLVKQAEALVQDKKWAEASSKLRRALQMVPDDANTRLNLAWIERETDERLESEVQIFLAARLLKPGSSSFHMLAESVEGNYVLGRLAILLGDVQFAKKLLEPVLILKPDHQDAKKAMEDIRKLEEAAKGANAPAN